MPRQRDTTLADTFTPTLHSSPYPTISPSNPSNHFTDRQPLNVCIIGASRGIGAEVAYAYARAGASSIILAGLPLSVEEGRLRDVVQRCRDVARKSWPGREGRLRVEGFAVDVAEAESVRGLVEGARAWLVEGNEGVDGQEVERARLDVLVLVSGWSGPVVLKVGDGETRDFGAVLDVNVKGTYHIAHFFIPWLLSSQGLKTFIAVGSFAACITSGHIANTAYCLSKFAQARLLEFISEQYKDEGLLSIGVHPGSVATDGALKTCPESFRDYLVDDPALCGAFCVWLCKEKRMWLSGRLVSANWDVDELLAKSGDVEARDLLKFGFRVGEWPTD